jgi:hypothetical protein
VEAEEQILGRLARSSGLRRQEVREFVRFEVVAISEGPLEAVVVRKLRRARRLRRDLGLSTEAVVIILRLLDRIEAVEGRNRGTVTSVEEPFI